MFRFMLSVGLLSASLALVAAGNVRADNPVTQQEVRTRMQKRPQCGLCRRPRGG